MKNTLEIDGVNLEFNKKKILQNIYLKCETNAITGLLGRNGSGKSTLFKLLMGELSAETQSIRINGKRLHNQKRKKGEISMLPQENFIPRHLKIKRIFDDFDLNFDEFKAHFSDTKIHLHEKIGNLSGGERRLIELFLIIKSNSKFIILDEPFSQIMPKNQEIIFDLLTKEKQRKGILITDHLPEMISRLSDDLYILSNGQTRKINNYEELRFGGYIY